MPGDDKFERLAELIRELCEATDALNREFACEERKFTIDGHLLGSIGEVLAKYIFDLTLERPSKEIHDALTKDGKRVQVKITAVNAGVSLYEEPDFLIALRLSDEGLEVLYNGEGAAVWQSCGKKQKNGQRRINNRKLRELNKNAKNPLPSCRPFPQIKRRGK